MQNKIVKSKIQYHNSIQLDYYAGKIKNTMKLKQANRSGGCEKIKQEQASLQAGYIIESNYNLLVRSKVNLKIRDYLLIYDSVYFPRNICANTIISTLTTSEETSCFNFYEQQIPLGESSVAEYHYSVFKVL